MTTLQERPNTALLVIDVQRGVVASAYERDAVIANIAALVDKALAADGVGRLVVTGAETDACIRSTIHGAFVRGYDVTLVADAHTTDDKSKWGAPAPDQVIAHTNLYWQYHSAPGRTAAVAGTKDV